MELSTPFVKETFKKVISFGPDLSHIWGEQKFDFCKMISGRQAAARNIRKLQDAEQEKERTLWLMELTWSIFHWNLASEQVHSSRMCAEQGVGASGCEVKT